MKNFITACDKEGWGFQNLEKKFQGLSEAKFEGDVFIISQIHEIKQEKMFEDLSIEWEAGIVRIKDCAVIYWQIWGLKTTRRKLKI